MFRQNLTSIIEGLLRTDIKFTDIKLMFDHSEKEEIIISIET